MVLSSNGSDSMNLPNLKEAGKRTKTPISFVLDDYKLPEGFNKIGVNKKY